MLCFFFLYFWTQKCLLLTVVLLLVLMAQLAMPEIYYVLLRVPLLIKLAGQRVPVLLHLIVMWTVVLLMPSVFRIIAVQLFVSLAEIVFRIAQHAVVMRLVADIRLIVQQILGIHHVVRNVTV
ncbi:MAG: hypothetical protein A3A58_00525 [Candidatus Blackburnbacteria bacterium RIFCSPLOWO2_01_FULL_41_27]|uniref:Uncharacterized protein n=1 Tax=Candidatus Blackburnbacteria bacterium RIFCSPLOWO2_01_FULL_41_27 TaxID=1797520 RepID=A0A1G1VHZ7_9BACT|nr:MAG: hypothetical protein A3A58_00525 [Candidatus Blackburnbacteria bacterium RIFCSPLOWO2_01_FULL_41_27]